MNVINKPLKLLLIILIGIFNFNISIADNLIRYKEAREKASTFKNKNPDSVFYYSFQAYNIAKELGDNDKQLDILLYIINMKARTNDLVEAIQYCDTIDLIINKYNMSEQRPEALMYRGNVLVSMNMHSEGLKLYFQGLNDSTVLLDTKLLSGLYYYIAITYAGTGDINLCKSFIRKGLRLPLENELLKEKLPFYLLYANCFDDSDSVQYFIDKAIDVFNNFPDLLYEKIVILSQQAMLDKALGRNEISRSYYLEAIDIAKKNDFFSFQSVLLNNYAYLLMDENKLDSAKLYFDRAIEIAINIGDIDLQYMVYDSYVDYFQETGNIDSAFKYSELRFVKREEFRKKQQLQRTSFFAALYKSEQNKKELLIKDIRIDQLWVLVLTTIGALILAIVLIIYFRQKVWLSKAKLESLEKSRSLAMANGIISGQSKERKRLSMDLHDGIGGKLAAMRFMLDNISKTNDNYTEILESLNSLHTNIRMMAKRIMPPELEKDGLIVSINGYIELINQSNEFELTFDTNLNERLHENLENNIYFILYELINNAVSHSKGNSVFVQVIEHGDLLSISVEDNGGGFEYRESSQGMGLKNIRSRVEYLGGSFNFESTTNDTLFMIEIPLILTQKQQLNKFDIDD